MSGDEILNITIDKKNGIPLYIQVKKQIMYLIKDGTLRVGSKMPTERELSQELVVSRNTISAAYNELESKGVLKSIRGNGTYVAEEAVSWRNEDSRKKINKFVDLALEEALECGIDPDDFLEIVNNRVDEKKDLMNNVTSAFVECNIEQSRMFSKEITSLTNVNTIPFTLIDLEQMSSETKDKLSACEVIISPFNHINEVNKFLNGWNKEIIGVSINPNLESIVRIARHPSDTKFSFICLSEEFIFKIKSALENAGLGDLSVEYFNGLNEDGLKEVIDRSEVLIVTPGRYKDICKFNDENKELIEFSYSLESASVKTLKSKIVELKYQRS
ncbi:GntR family transcriptional regulator [Clostridium sp.]|uniref:GntR family transcriptional regulator n=1 Tax=Clostridium sp. TaxID=1506 RepID=UPI0032167E2D